MLPGNNYCRRFAMLPSSKWGSGGPASCNPSWQFTPERGKLVSRTYGQSGKDFSLPPRVAAFFVADAHARGTPQGGGQDQGGAQGAGQDLADALHGTGRDQGGARGATQDLAGAQGTGQELAVAQGAR